MAEQNKCPVCGGIAKLTDLGGGPNVQCKRCGNYKLGWIAEGAIEKWDAKQRAKLSSWIRERPNGLIRQEDIEQVLNIRPPSVVEKSDRLLLHLAKSYPKLGERIILNEESCKELCSIAWCEDISEVLFILDAYLVKESQFISLGGGDNDWRVEIQPRGWTHLYALLQGNTDSQIGFIAMWFNDEVNDAWKAIDRGIRNAGYEPLRIDQKQHNNKIDDEIVAGIRRSKFLVADFTGHRGGVYFEAGFAKGLGLEVIWLCRKDQMDEVHFDTRQYAHIIWEADKLDELSKALKNRIEATIGRGPLQAAT